MTLPTLAATCALLLLGEPAGAVTTRTFVLATAEDLSAGELDHVAVRSSGEVVVGPDTVRLALPAVPSVYSLVQSADGRTTYFGTGNDGVIFRLQGDALEPFARTQQLLVASLALAADGTLYAGTIPEGRIFAVTPAGQMRELVRLENVESIWSLAYHQASGTLYAGTGPDGKIFAVDHAGHASVFYDSDQGHVMSLALGEDGTLFAGTDGRALVLQIGGPGRAQALADLPGNEVTAMALDGSGLVVIGNEFPTPPSGSTPPRPRPGAPSAPSSSTDRPRPGKGRLYRIGFDGRVERLLSNDSAQYTAVQVGADGTAYVADGQNGRVYRVSPDRTSDTWIDVDERQVRAIALTGRSPIIATGDAGAVYRVLDAHPERSAWNSKVLDAGFAARWGRVIWRGSGTIELSTRSGNTEQPDTTWSDWSGPMTAPGPVHSAGARYLQLRIRFARDPRAVVRSVTTFYLPQNQRAVLTEVTVQSKQAPAPAKMGEARDPSPIYKIAWRVDNPDADRVRYRLRYRLESNAQWLTILRETEIVTATSYDWNTRGVPDGWYRVQVQASDELSNPPAYTIRDERESSPVRIDNHDPELSDVRVAGNHVLGRARDALGPIVRLEVSVDSQDGQLVFPSDDLFDSPDESFDVEIPGYAQLAPGPHTVAVRTWDAEGNQATREAIFEVAAPAPARAAR